MKIKENKLDFFRELYEDAVSQTSYLYEQLREYALQYKGSKVIDPKKPNAAPASVVRNITYELIESQIDTGIPPCRVDAERWSEKNGRNAKAIERLCNNIRNRLPFEEMNDIDERYTYVYGGSVWTVEWDESIMTHDEVGDVRVNVTNPQKFYGEPGIYRAEDMEYCFFVAIVSRDQAERMYDKEIPDNRSESDVDDNVVVITCYYRDGEGNVCKFVYTGDLVLQDISDYYARKRYVCEKCGRDRELSEDSDKCACGGKFKEQNEEYEELTHDIVLSDGSIIPAMSPVIKDGKRVREKIKVPRISSDGMPEFVIGSDGKPSPAFDEIEQDKLAPTRIRWYKPRSLPIVIRKNTSQLDMTEEDFTANDTAPNMQFLGQSDCEYIKHQQRAVNKYESRIQRKLLRSAVMPYMPEDAQIQPSNSVFEEVIRLKPGEHPANYGTIDTTPNINLDIVQSDRQYQHAKFTLGITSSYQGQADNTANSGKAKELQIRQSAGRLTSKRVLKNLTYSKLDRIIFEYFLAYADEPRPISYRDEWGRVHNLAFNRYDFIEYDELTGEYYYDDRYLFSVDASATVEGIREQIWQINQQNFSGGMYGNPAEITSIIRYWQAQESAHYPGAREQVEYFLEKYNQQKAMAEAQAQMSQAQLAQAMSNAGAAQNDMKGATANGNV